MMFLISTAFIIIMLASQYRLVGTPQVSYAHIEAHISLNTIPQLDMFLLML